MKNFYYSLIAIAIPFVFASNLTLSADESRQARASEPSMKMHQTMSQNMEKMQSMRMSGNIDEDFARMMKQHHQSGIEMAEIQARSGKDPEMRKQAEKIIQSQKKEIQELDRWLETKANSDRR